MSKQNTKHIIGFAAKTHKINTPEVVDLTTANNYATPGYVKKGYWETKI